MSTSGVKAPDFLAQERDLKFKQWLQEKELRDKALEYMRKLDSKRADSEESLKEVAIAMYAVDKMLGTSESAPAVATADGDENEPQRVRKSMKSVWVKWACEHHKFSDVRLSDAEYANFSGAVREFLQEAIDPDTGKKIFTLPSVKYTFPAQSINGQPPKPLTNDQKQQNAIVTRCLRRVWRAVQDETQDRVLEYVSRSQIRSSGGSLSAEAESKSKAAASERAPSRPNESNRAKLEYNCLYDLSMKRLKEWIEEDEDKVAESLREKRIEKMTEAKISHEQFVKRKDSLRLRMPDNIVLPAPPAMTYGKVITAVQPKGNFASLTVVEKMAGSGLKYVHADSKGRAGLEGDLEKSRKLLIKQGIILKENFDGDSNEYHRELEENQVLAERKQATEKMKEESAKAYESWVAVKELREQAVRLLGFIDRPGGDADVRSSVAVRNSSMSLGAKQTEGNMRSSVSSMATSKRHSVSKADLELAIDVGKNLKLVDRTLFADWCSWCVPNCFSAKVAAIMWDSFEPKACDVHSAAYSQVRETFSKLLKPGVDYKQKFIDFAKAIIRRRGRDSSSKEEKDKMIGKLTLSKQKLVDAFDCNGDGVITLQEFIDFTGPKRDKKGGSSMLINQKCSWLTTCKVTGMANGYTVSSVPARGLRNAWGDDSKVAESKDRDREEGGDEEFEGITGRVVIKTLKNGEKRMCAEKAERLRREEILRKFNLIDRSEEEGKKEAEEKNDYEDDYEEDEDQEGGKGKGSQEQQQCAFIRCTPEQRREGIRFLTSLTREARQEAWLQDRMTNGKCPGKPKLLMENPNEVCDRDEDFDPCTELQLIWEPENKSDLVSFFLLEFAGATGGLLRSETYKEVCRDPPDASPESTFACGFRIKDLDPGTTYAFRLRAYNGFGPGQFCYSTFTTLTSAPRTPMVIRVSHDSALLKWTFSKKFKERLAELKAVFERADTDRSGGLTRKELTTAICSANASLTLFLKVVAKKLKLREWGSLFDRIESDDNGLLSWDEFERFFMSCGWMDDESIFKKVEDIEAKAALTARPGAAAGGGNVRSSTTSIRSVAPAGSASVSAGEKVTYIVEKCVSEREDLFEKVHETTVGQALIARLQPGQSYRFRVYSINASGLAGEKSECVIVHTMLETPAAPVCLPKNVGSTKVVLNWKTRKQHQSSRDQSVVNRMVGDWAGTAADEEFGVDVKAAFRKYDRNGDSTISPDELAILLEDLNVEATEGRLAEAFSVFDQNGDGSISFEEFSAWWRRDEVVYVLKRSKVIVPLSQKGGEGGVESLESTLLQTNEQEVPTNRTRRAGQFEATAEGSVNGSVAGSTASQKRLSASNAFDRLSRTKTGTAAVSVSGTGIERNVAVPVTVYRGDKAGQTVGGLFPNRLYHFRLRYCGSRCNSEISPPLVLMTAPLELPDMPLLIGVTSSIARVKWYPPKYGAYKFIVQLKGADRSAAARVNNATVRPQESSEVPCEDGWTTVFCAYENNWTSTALASDSEYEVRVICINCQGACSKPSPVLLFRTLPRTATAQLLTPRNVDSTFTIDCTFDIVVGDTVLITERIFSVEDPIGFESTDLNASQAGSRTRAGSRPRSGSRIDSGPDTRASLTGSKALFGSKSGIKSTMRLPSKVVSSLQRNEAAGGTFVGERTIAAHVVKDNYLWLREYLPSNQQYKSAKVDEEDDDETPVIVEVSKEDCSRVSNLRNLWLEVVWQQCSNEACKAYELKPGTILQRLQSNIEQFQVFRTAWVDEPQRQSQWVEWTGLAECNVQTDC